jgi:hypothetical protein
MYLLAGLAILVVINVVIAILLACASSLRQHDDRRAALDRRARAD